jgi:nicotinamide mononucleotide transporter
VAVTDSPSTWIAALAASALAAGPAELVAVALGLAYIVLAIRQQRGCWIAGGASTAIYIAVFIDAGLYL